MGSLQDLPSELISILQLIERSQQDLEPIGPSSLHLLSLLSSSTFPLSKGKGKERERERIASSLLHLSSERLLSYHYKAVPDYWRRLYTDATTYKVVYGWLGDLAVGLREKEREARALERVRELDMCLIVAGAPGEGRKEVIFGLIKLVQERDLSGVSALSIQASVEEGIEGDVTKSNATSSDERPLKRPRTSSLSNSSSTHYITNPIPRHSTPYFNSSAPPLHPIIIPSSCSHWPSSSSWRSPSYLKSIAGRGRIVPVELGSDYTKEGWSQGMMSWDKVVDLWSNESSPEEEEEQVFYLAQHDLFHQFPGLLKDILMPDLVWELDLDGEGGYERPKTEEGYLLNAWMGPKGTLSQAHTDPWWNCYAQVVGRKWVWVAPPECGRYMSAFSSSEETSSGTAPSTSSVTAVAATTERTDGEGSSNHFMTNTSRIDVSALSPSSSDNLSDFDKHVKPHAMQAVLEEGDMMLMPPGWWHAMKSLEKSFSVSIWF